jgi:hypothetical protein
MFSVYSGMAAEGQWKPIMSPSELFKIAAKVGRAKNEEEAMSILQRAIGDVLQKRGELTPENRENLRDAFYGEEAQPKDWKSFKLEHKSETKGVTLEQLTGTEASWAHTVTISPPR